MKKIITSFFICSFLFVSAFCQTDSASSQKGSAKWQWPFSMEWTKIIAGILGGGAVGAVLKQYFDNRKNRIQYVSYRVEVEKFYEKRAINLAESQIVFIEGTREFKFETLYIGTIWIYNNSSLDFKNYVFGLTLENSAKFIQIEPKKTDRHHSSIFSVVPTLDNQISEFDIKLDPFNRNERYGFNFIISVQSAINESNLVVSTSESTRLKKVKSESEILSFFNKIVLTFYGQRY